MIADRVALRGSPSQHRLSKMAATEPSEGRTRAMPASAGTRWSRPLGGGLPAKKISTGATPPAAAALESRCEALRTNHPRGVATGYCAYTRALDRGGDGHVCEMEGARRGVLDGRDVRPRGVGRRPPRAPASGAHRSRCSSTRAASGRDGHPLAEARACSASSKSATTGLSPLPGWTNSAGSDPPGRCDGGTPVGPENRRFSGGRSRLFPWHNPWPRAWIVCVLFGQWNQWFRDAEM